MRSRQCMECKYRGYFNFGKSNIEVQKDRSDNIYCDYGYYSKKGPACKRGSNGELIDTRGDDPDNCLLFEKGKKSHGDMGKIFIKKEKQDGLFY